MGAEESAVAEEAAVPEGAIKDPQGSSDEGQNPNLIAYRIDDWPPMRLAVAPADRD